MEACRMLLFWRQLQQAIMVGVLILIFEMRKDPEYGNKLRTLDMKVVSGLAQIPIFNKMTGKDFIGRLHTFFDYMDYVDRDEVFLYSRIMLTGPSTQVLAKDDNNNIHYGVNYASADYLGLAQHPQAIKKAVTAVQGYTVCSGNTPSSLGVHELFLQLQNQLSEYWDMNVLIFPTGWMGGFGIINALIRPTDHIVMDYICHNCLQEGAISATKKLKRFEHLNQDEMERMLRETREQDPDNAILVVTEGLFSMDADSPDLIYYQQVAKKYNAYLLIDCAHDFGHLGPTGKGAWEQQGLKDFSNVLLCGTGSKCLSTNIGFVGTKDPKIFELLRYLTDAYSNATTINPAQAAASLAQLHILRTSEGVERRRKVTENYNYLRGQLEARGHRIIGNPCAIMPLFIGNEIISRLVSRIMMDRGVHVNGIQYPVVKIGQARLRVCLVPQHTKAQLDRFVTVFEQSLAQANKILEQSLVRYNQEMSQETKPKL